MECSHVCRGVATFAVTRKVKKIKPSRKKSRRLAGDDVSDVVLHTLNMILYYVMEARGRRTAPNLIRVTHLNIYYDTQYTVLPGGRSLMPLVAFAFGPARGITRRLKAFNAYLLRWPTLTHFFYSRGKPGTPRFQRPPVVPVPGPTGRWFARGRRPA